MSPSHTLYACRHALTLAFCAALLAAAGCKKDPPPPAAETKTEAKEATSPAKKAKRAANKDEGVEVPTEEDFELEVEKQITASSDLGKELDLLEKQIRGQ